MNESVNLEATKQKLLQQLAVVAASSNCEGQLEKLELLHKRINAIERCLAEVRPK